TVCGRTRSAFGKARGTRTTTSCLSTTSERGGTSHNATARSAPYRGNLELQGGIDYKRAAEVLGHSSPMTTLVTYAHRPTWHRRGSRRRDRRTSRSGRIRAVLTLHGNRFATGAVFAA